MVMLYFGCWILDVVHIRVILDVGCCTYTNLCRVMHFYVAGQNALPPVFVACTCNVGGAGVSTMVGSTRLSAGTPRCRAGEYCIVVACRALYVNECVYTPTSITRNNAVRRRLFFVSFCTLQNDTKNIVQVWSWFVARTNYRNTGRRADTDSWRCRGRCGAIPAHRERCA